LTPYILLGRKELPRENSPTAEQVYDGDRQIWIDKNSGAPVVSSLRNQAQNTRFGETTFTMTREGADQTEVVQASQFGETVYTRTHEGVDQTEITAIQPTQLGETIMTKTREGTDQLESGSLQELDASYSHF
jgi:hypothetical protein